MRENEKRKAGRCADSGLGSDIPELVRLARENADSQGFGLACDDAVGRLLAVLGASVPADGRILELGTGVGVGLGWIVHGLALRRDVTVRSIERDLALAAVAKRLPWPAAVSVICGDALDELRERAAFDLIFADAEGGKLTGLDQTIAALRPGGLLVMDDMNPVPDDDFHTRLFPQIAAAEATIVHHPHLVSVRMDWATGILMAAKIPHDPDAVDV